MSKINKIRLDGTDYDIERGMLPEVVQELPQTGSEDTMYLVPSENPGTQSETASGEFFTVQNDLPYESPLASVEMLGNATQSGTPTPDAPIAVQTVTGENTVKIAGKNILPDTYTSQTINQVAFTKNSDGSITANGTASGTAFYTVADNLILDAGTYILSSTNICPDNAYLQLIEKISGSPVLADTNGVNKKTFTITGRKTTRIYFRIRNNATVNQTVFPQLELGNSASSFEPYQAQEFEVNLGSLELAKIGNYQDRIYKEDSKWYIEKQVGKLVLNGSENWALVSTATNTARFKVQGLTSNIVINETSVLLMSNYFTCFPSNERTQDKIGMTTYINQDLYIRTDVNSISAVAQLKTWLGTHNTIVYYALATPTTTEITNEALIAQLDALESASLYLGVNNIGTETLNAMPTLVLGYDVVDPQKKYDEYVWVEEGQEYELVGQAGAIQQLQRDVSEVDEELLSRAVVFDTVADMKLSNNLIDGSYAHTLGFHTVGDDGGALYRISNTGVADEMSVIAVGSVYANLIVESTVTPEMFGAYGDNSHDDQDSINACLQSDASFIRFNGEKTYLVKGYEVGQPEGGTLANLSAQTGIIVTSNKVIDLGFATIKCIPNDRRNYNIFTLQNVENVVIQNGIIEGDVGSHTGSTGEWGYGVALRKTDNITLRNLTITKCWGDGINIKGYHDDDLGNNTNIYIKSCKCIDNRRQGMSIEHGENIIVTESSFNETGETASTAPSAGINIEPSTAENVNNVKITRCEFNYNKGSGITLMDTTTTSDLSTHNVYDITIDGCNILENMGNYSSAPLLVNKAKDYTIKNCTVTKNSTSNTAMFVNYLGGDGHIINNIFNDINISFRPDMMSDGYFEVIGNTFNQSISLQYNRCVEQLSYTGANTGNRVRISGNKFIIAPSLSNINVAGFIMVASNGFNFAEIDNNYCQYSKTAIRLGIPCSVHDNIIVGCQDACISMLDNTSSIEISSNHFERCGWNSYIGSPILTVANAHLVITSNNYFKYFLNSALDIESPAYPDNVIGWKTVTPAVLVSENNNIVASS